jgi:hypothetical protein
MIPGHEHGKTVTPELSFRRADFGAHREAD